MKRNYWFVVSIIVFVMVSLLMAASIPVQAAQPLPDYKVYDIGPELREWDTIPARIQGDFAALSPEEIDAREAEAMAAVANTPYEECVLDIKIWMSLDNYNGFYFFDFFYLVAESDGAELWVQTDLSWPEGDPRPTPEVTCEQAEYLVGEFDDNIYLTEVDFFDEPDFHDGSFEILTDPAFWSPDPVPDFLQDPEDYDPYDADGKQVILVSNIVDDSYYDSTYPNYIAGFYSPSFEAFFDRNIMSIDAYDWENRVGPDGDRPYLYEGVFAHEYQHLLHDDYDSDEVNFINEGLSMFAEFLTGYVVGNDAYSTFEALPENSLVAWGDQGGREIVADYGLVFLYHMYLYEKFGQEFIQYEFMNQDNGITAINSTLGALGFEETFDEIYHDFSVAVLIDAEMDDYKYGFEALDVGIDIGHQGQRNPDAYATPGAPPWGTDYYLLWGYESLVDFYFNGVPFNPLAWTSDGDTLFGGSGDLVDNMLIAEVDLTGVTGAELTFDTMYQIEPYWDYGFVQVSTDGGNTWTSLENDYTTFDYVADAHPDIIANLPGLTGDSGDWITMSFDLSAYDGQEILVAFRYMTDWSYNDPGWYIDNVTVAGVFSSDGSSTDGFGSLAEILGIQNSYTITLVGERMRKGESVYEVQTILSDDYIGSFENFKRFFDNYRTIVMLITYDAEEGTTLYADYSYEFINGGGNVFNNK